jgi:DNA repair protein RadA/Sms
MPKKNKVQFVCQSCGQVESRWFGRCPACQAWNTAVEEPVEDRILHKKGRKKAPSVEPVRIEDIDLTKTPRLSTGISEADRSLGGGLVPGSITLLGGEPGIGKSTLLTQISGHISNIKGTVLYISGEESLSQVKIRTDRLGVDTGELFLLAETDVFAMADHIKRTQPFLAIVDSIQSTYRDDLTSAPGSVSQVRESAAVLLKVAKDRQVPIILVGHVTKEGFLAGPRVLEHMVDTVLQMEGERHGGFRVLRPIKNRFGSTNEIGLFEMRERGLFEVTNPAALLLGHNYGQTPGSAPTVSLEGTRPLLLEVQALTCPSSGFGAPRRNTSGVEPGRLAMLLAVLEKKQGIPLASQDVYVNIAGGFRISETAIDVGVCLALASSYKGLKLDASSLAVGEVGLSAEIRPVRAVERRLSEAKNLGMTTCLIPEPNLREIQPSDWHPLKLVGVRNLSECLQFYSLT